MKSFRIVRPGEFEFIDREIPEIAEKEVLVRTRRLGYCGSDLNTWRGSNPLVQYPRIIGHEISGIIEKTGKAVPPHIRPGAKVAVIPYTACGHCSSCRKGRPNACKKNETLGVQRDGGFSEYLVIPWDKLIISETLSFDELVMVEPLSVGFHAVSRGGITRGDKVAVLGCGMIGMGAVIAALSGGAEVIAVDVAEKKLEQAKNLGVAHTVQPGVEDLHRQLCDITAGEGPDVVIEAIGLPETFVQAVEEVAFSGTVVYIGYAKQPVTYETKMFVQKELNICGSRNALPEDFKSVIRVLEDGKFPVLSLISERVSFDEAGKALRAWSDDPSRITKMIVEM